MDLILSRTKDGFLVSHESMRAPLIAEQVHVPTKQCGRVDAGQLSAALRRRIAIDVWHREYAFVSPSEAGYSELREICRSRCGPD